MFWGIIFLIAGLTNIWVSLSSKLDTWVERKKQFGAGVALVILSIIIFFFHYA